MFEVKNEDTQTRNLFSYQKAYLCEWMGKRTNEWINPFHANVPFLYPLKTSENQGWMDGIFIYPRKTNPK